MASAGAKRQPEAQNGAAVGLAQVAEIPEVTQCPGPGDKSLVPAHETCRTPGENKWSVGHSFELEPQDEGINRGEEGLNPGVEAGEERGPKPTSSIVRPSHGPKRKPINLVPGLGTPALPGPSYHAHPRAEAELPAGMLLQKEQPEGSHSESSLSAKQHKKAKKRKSVGAPVPPAVASTSAPTETLGLERKVQRLRPLYQYINYCNPELNQAGDGDREPEVEPESELALAPEGPGVEQLQLQTLLPVAGELGLGLALPCPNTLVPLTHSLPSLGQEVGEDPGGLSSLRAIGSLKAEVDKTTQVDIDKMLSVCAAPLVPPLSPQYK
ncbi:uncharacterized protein C16orf86 homolog isoform X1 [Peromyscus eremicus]|uniref:uncharacterized protein C16orf86 homolog isoform X1 n=1 Tax=Peromyscus eremicus TaxID=42410 RepID=UPI0027DCE91C|nr:uncharacterized protein C16orf86 homolog isoform X1 [Peromyscus eremicus]